MTIERHEDEDEEARRHKAASVRSAIRAREEVRAFAAAVEEAGA